MTNPERREKIQKWLKEKPLPMSEADWAYWEGRFDQYDDLPDGAWWSACESDLGGYDRMMSYLKADQLYDPLNKEKQ